MAQDGNKQPSPELDRLPDRGKGKPKKTSALPSHPLTTKVRKPFLPTVAVTLSKGGTKSPSDLLKSVHSEVTWILQVLFTRFAHYKPRQFFVDDVINALGALFFFNLCQYRVFLTVASCGAFYD